MLENFQLQLLLDNFAGRVGRRQLVVIAYLVEENRGVDSADQRSVALSRRSGKRTSKQFKGARGR